MSGKPDPYRPSASFASRSTRLNMYPTQPHKPGIDLNTFITKHKTWITQDNNEYTIHLGHNTNDRLSGLMKALGHTFYNTTNTKQTQKLRQYNDAIANFGIMDLNANIKTLKDLLQQAMPKKKFSIKYEPDPYNDVSAFPSSTSGIGGNPKTGRPAGSGSGSGGKGGEVKAVLAALVIKDDIYHRGTPMSEVSAPAKKWLRKFMDKDQGGGGPAFLAKHAHVGGVRKGSGWVYHLKPKRGKTVLDIASAIDSVQNVKGPPPPMYESAGVRYAMWLVPSAP